MTFTVSFSDFELTDYFTVENVHRSILPPREVNLLTVPAKHGAYFQNARYGVREISVDVIIKGKSPADLMNLMRFLAYCLDIPAPTELVMSDEPTRVYYAILSDSTSIEEMLTVGRGTLTFLCPDPFAYSSDLKTVVPDEGFFLFENQGTTTTYPIFRTTFTTDSTFYSLTSPNGVVLIGSPADVEKETVQAEELVFKDPMQSVEGWVNAGNILDGGRQNIGKIAVHSSGDSIYCSDYGEAVDGNKMWHGAGFRKNFPRPVQDFTFKTRMSFSSQDGTSKLDGDQKGRIEIYLFSASGLKIGKMVMRDSYASYEFNIPEIYIGNTTILEDQPSAPGKTSTKQKEYTYYTTTKSETVASIIKKYKISLATFRSLNGFGSSVTSNTKYAKGKKLKVGSKTVTKSAYPEEVGSWNDFFGEFTLERKGTTWYAEVSRMDSDLKKTKTIKKTIYDSGKTYTQEPVAYVVMSFLQYETDPVAQKMHVTDMKLYSHNKAGTIDDKNQIIFRSGDELEVDMGESMVRLNGEVFMNRVDVGSTFFPVDAGTTEVKVNTDDLNAYHEADYFERFL